MRRCLLLSLSLLACTGPEASDAEVCRDLIHRLCHEPRCPEVDASLAPGPACEESLLSNTGCGADDFAFSSPPRVQVLTCRVSLLRAGASTEVAPRCEDVADTINDCPAVVAFLRGDTR